jgi:hypothetical protein
LLVNFELLTFDLLTTAKYAKLVCEVREWYVLEPTSDDLLDDLRYYEELMLRGEARYYLWGDVVIVKKRRGYLVLRL